MCGVDRARHAIMSHFGDFRHLGFVESSIRGDDNLSLCSGPARRFESRRVPRGRPRDIEEVFPSGVRAPATILPLFDRSHPYTIHRDDGSNHQAVR